MTTIVVPDEQLGQLGRKYHDLFRRVREGTLPIEKVLGSMQDLIEGKFGAIPQSLRRFIDCDAAPFLPEGWSIKPEDQIASGVRGEITFDPAKIASHFVDGQKDGKSIVGHELKKLLEGQPVLPANVLDYLLAHPELIPDAWKGKYLYFWGTIYRDSDGSLCVRCLYWSDGRWDWGYDWLGRRFGGQGPSALLAS